MIVIVDYGLGNLGSIKNMLRRVGYDSVISSDKNILEKAKKIILPGVGAFDNGMANINQLGLLDVLNYKALTEKVPVLGVCLGVQLLTRRSEEGKLPGLGWVQADVKKFISTGESNQLKIPHMGWNEVRIKKDSRLCHNLQEYSRYYFVHSYHVVCDDPEDILMTCNYGGEVVAAVQHGNIMGTQFHPEKSHKFGMTLFKNFGEM